ncbi:MAG TPA: hypothetical protein VJ732_00650 [Bryobacteraceae bacterium]|nr:hypothetical protein [Bryobacteraceae bacterium]
MMTKTAAAEVCFERVETPGFSVKAFWTTQLRNLARYRCQLVHRSISRPVNGKYRCWTCLREFETDF